jgi:lipopolysaccharide-induced tumor necrosis factor-alpha factor
LYYIEEEMASVEPIRTVPIMKPSSNQPVPCTCPYCHQSIVTRVEKSNGLVVWLAATGICLLGCALGCCLIPFFIDGIKV